MKELIGTGVALVTPFTQNGEVDHEALAGIVEFNIQGGVDYLVISGTTGESVTINKEEKNAIIQTVIDSNKGRKPLVIGIGGNNTAAIIDELKHTNLEPFAAVLSVSPYYSKPTQEGLYEHFKAVAAHCPKPIILYNVPGRTSKNMEPSTSLRLANDVANIVAIKEAGNNVHQYLELLKNKPDGFHIISGDDDLALSAVLAGGSGVISVVGQAVPKEFSSMINYGLEGKAKEAYELHFKLMDLTSAVFAENNPAGIKAVLNTLGLCNSTVRLPLVEASDKLKSEIKSILNTLNG
ncbi:MAG: 4-hydroxy-tetrahydrodipicolinate synthase [Bacteroidia bacterium]|nr:4-hydroxy-tetrahydrodipicolinate synthase [Bacteroidia bacterium]MBT8268537.1 4-hydroxy-tetrahydrodipicolinate synthase [Bacteroidia bacterium]NNF83322.1 4-hydroxy-tetrahydrodipicolinate synthase [Flavobacteriaceae bacterium]NNK71196.1 4-hydroxy-tetrahydrodipicolinate synthase [Flavobacteriaceae bacterium]